MASGISSALGYYMIGLQSAKGAPATVFYRYRASGAPTLGPVKETDRYHMTDTGRDLGDAFTKNVHVAGDLPMYLHPDGMALPWLLVLGGEVNIGAGPYTHTISGADALPWCTIERVVGGVITERFLDCQVNTLRLEAEAGMPPEMTLGIMGITPTWVTPFASPTVISADPMIYWEAKSLLKIATVAQPIHKFSIEVNNNVSMYQADDWLMNDIDPGKREISFSFAQHFTSPTAEPKYREFIYGSDAGTTASTTLVQKAYDLKLLRSAAISAQFLLPQVRAAAVPVNPNPSGEAIDVEVAASVEKPSGSPALSVVIIDSHVTTGAV